VKLADHPYEDLAKFGYKLDMKVKRTKTPSNIFGYILESTVKIWPDSIFLFFFNLENLGIFYEKILRRLKSDFSSQKIYKHLLKNTSTWFNF
jgi:hypothetical protein